MGLMDKVSCSHPGHFKKLKDDLIQVKKSGNKIHSGYHIMLVDCIEKMAKNKNMDPELFVVQGAKKHIKQLQEARDKGMDVNDELKYALETCGDIIPKEMPDEEVKTLIINLIKEKTETQEKVTMSTIMQHLKNSGENIDMKNASSLAREILQ